MHPFEKKLSGISPPTETALALWDNLGESIETANDWKEFFEHPTKVIHETF